jgi:hypothetical protein
MRRFSLLAAVAALALVLQGRASAQTTTPTKYVFAAVDAVSMSLQYSRLTVKGILEGEQAPVERSVSFSSSTSLAVAVIQSCERFALLAMEKPGAYRLELLPGSYNQYPTCTLVRVNP